MYTLLLNYYLCLNQLPNHPPKNGLVNLSQLVTEISATVYNYNENKFQKH